MATTSRIHNKSRLFMVLKLERCLDFLEFGLGDMASRVAYGCHLF